MRYGFVGAVAVLALAGSACGARGQVHVGAAVDPYAGLDHIQMAVGDVYGMPVGHPPSYIYPDELPVVYLLAREAGVSPELVMSLREAGWSWMDITYHLGVDPYVYVAHLPRQRGYWGYPGRSYRHLTDRHIIDYVNLALWASYHRRPVTQIIVIRHRVPTWAYYVHYHAPRVVYVNNRPRRYDRPSDRRGTYGRRDEEPRRAQPRDETPQRGVERATTQRPARTIDRAPGAAPGGQQAEARTIQRPATPVRPGTDETRAVTPPSRPASQQSTRAVTPPTRVTVPAARPTAPPTQPTTEQARPVPQPTRPAATPPRTVTPPTRPVTQQNRTVTPPTRPSAQPTRTPTPQAQPQRPVTPPSRPAATPSRAAATPSRPAATPSRPAATPSRPAATPSRPAATPSRPAATPSRPAATPSRPAATPSRPAATPSRPAPRPSRPAASRSSGGSKGDA